MKEHNLDEKVLKGTTVRDSNTDTEQTVRELTKSYWDGPAHAQTNDISDSANLVEASKRIKQFNNELHKPGGPLANSDVELVGFDSKGRLLMIHRDGAGHVDRKFLVDSESGKIVARTKSGDMHHWEKSHDYEKSGRHPIEWSSQHKDGASIWRDESGHVREVTRANGDAISVSMNAEGKPATIKLGQEEWTVNAQGMATAYRSGDGPAQALSAQTQMEMLSDGTLQITDNNSLRRSLLPGGALVQSAPFNGHWMPLQVSDPYGDTRTITRDPVSGDPTEITLTRADNSMDSYRPIATIPGIKQMQGAWQKSAGDMRDADRQYIIQVNPDGSLVQFLQRDKYVTFGNDGSIVTTSPTGKEVQRPSFHAQQPAPPDQF